MNLTNVNFAYLEHRSAQMEQLTLNIEAGATWTKRL